jgi:hypothetical protein
MKAEHRKELQTNLLADRMGRLVQGVRSGPRSTSVGVWVIAVLALATLAGWYFADSTRGTQGSAWVRLGGITGSVEDQNLGTAADLTDERALNEVIQNYPGTLPARAARYQRARMLLNRGLKSLYGTNRSLAIEDLETARQLYKGLAAECAGNDILVPEALMGVAKAEEALVGVPRKTDEPESSRGDLDQALQWYDRLARAYSNSFLGEQAAKHATELRANRDQVVRFYADLNKSAGKSPPSGNPPFTP